MLSKLVVVLCELSLVIAKGTLENGLPTKENLEKYSQKQYQNDVIGEKYVGALYDDINFVNVDDEAVVVNEDTIEDDSKGFHFIPPEATIFRGKRAVYGAAPFRNVFTETDVMTNVNDASGVVPFDAHVDPDFPAEAPVARGLQNIPDGWNIDKNIDWEFKSGYRHGSAFMPAQITGHKFAPSRGQTPFAEIPEQLQDKTVEASGPYIATANGLRPVGQLQTFTLQSPYRSSSTTFWNSANQPYIPGYDSWLHSVPFV